MAKQEQQNQTARWGGVARDPAQNSRSLFAPGELSHMNPFSLMRRMTEEMDRVFGEFGWNRGESTGSSWAPAIEVSHDAGKYLVRAELPGIDPNDVKLEVTDDAVILQGERKSESRENKGGMQVTERQYGHFYRSIPLPEGAKSEDAKASFHNGLLEITVPVQEQQSSKRRSIPIEGASGQPGTSGKAA